MPATIHAATAEAPTLRRIGSLDAVLKTATISGTLAYAGTQNFLSIIDVSDIGRPTLLSKLDLSGDVSGIFVRNDFLYIANYLYGLQIVDVHDPLAPSLRGSLALQGNPSDIDVVNDLAYIPAYNYDLQIIDVSDPTHPILRGHSTDSTGSITGVKVIGNRAYVAGLGGLMIFDVSQPETPIRLGYFNSVANNGGNGYNLDVVGTLAYLADGGGGLQIIDVSNPGTPVLLGALDIPSPIYSLAVRVAGNRAYIAGREGGLQVVDVSDPSSPKALTRRTTIGWAYDLQIVGDRLYVADYTGGLQIFGIASPAGPTLLGGYGLAGNSWNAWLSGNFAYVAAGYDGLRIVDVSTPARPVLYGSLALPGQLFDIQVVGMYAYAGDYESGELFVLDVSDPAHPALVGSVATPQRAVAVQVIGNLVYVADGGGGLAVVDVSNPAKPSLLSSLNLLSFARNLQVVGNLAYIASEFGGLKIVDISDPAHPVLRGGLNLSAVEGISVANNLAYLAAGSSLSIVDISNPASPSLRGSIGLLGQAQDVDVDDKRAYVTSSGALSLIDVSDPAAPQLIDTYQLGGQNQGVQVQDGLIYITGYLNGLQILSTTPELAASSAIINSDGGTATSADGTVQLQFSANLVATPLTVMYLSKLRTLSAPTGSGGVVRRFISEARDTAGQAISQLDQPYLMSIDYTDAQLGELGISEANLNLAYWDGASWVTALPCTGCGVDTVANRVLIRTRQFTEYILFDTLAPTPPPPPQLITTAGGSVTNLDKTVGIVFPAGSVLQTTAVTYTEILTSTHLFPAGQLPLRIFRLEARTLAGQNIAHFDAPYTLTASYDDAQLAARHIVEASLAVVLWDGSAWVPISSCSNCALDRENNHITATADDLSEFALVGNNSYKVFMPLSIR